METHPYYFMRFRPPLHPFSLRPSQYVSSPTRHTQAFASQTDCSTDGATAKGGGQNKTFSEGGGSASAAVRTSGRARRAKRAWLPGEERDEEEEGDAHGHVEKKTKLGGDDDGSDGDGGDDDDANDDGDPSVMRASKLSKL